MTPPGFFLIFDIFKIIQNNSVCWTSYLRNHTSYQGCIWSWLMVNTCKRIISAGIILHFFQILILGVNSGAEEQKMACASTPYLSKHTSYDRIFCCTSLKLWHIQMLFTFFQKGKIWPKMAKNSVSLNISGTVPHMIVVFGTHV